MWYRAFLVGLLVVALTSFACSDTKDAIISAAAGDPVPSGMAVLNANAGAAIVTSAVTPLLAQAVSASDPNKPSANNLAVGAFPEETPSCITFSGGAVDGTTPLPAARSVIFNGCVAGPVTVTGSADISITEMAVCTEDEPNVPFDHDVVIALEASVSGTVEVTDGPTVNFTSFLFDVENAEYDGFPFGTYPAGGPFGTCGLTAAHVGLLGAMNFVVELGGQGVTTTLGFGVDETNHVEVEYVDADDHVELEMNGPMSVDSACTDSPVSFIIATDPTNKIKADDTGITGGRITATHTDSTPFDPPVDVDFLTDPGASPCDGFDL